MLCESTLHESDKGQGSRNKHRYQACNNFTPSNKRGNDINTTENIHPLVLLLLLLPRKPACSCMPAAAAAKKTCLLLYACCCCCCRFYRTCLLLPSLCL
jgi:hypothetical protein